MISARKSKYLHPYLVPSLREEVRFRGGPQTAHQAEAQGQEGTSRRLEGGQLRLLGAGGGQVEPEGQLISMRVNNIGWIL